MKKILFLLSLGLITSTCFGQDLPCTPSGTTIIGQPTITVNNPIPTKNPLNPRLAPPSINDRILYFTCGLGGNFDSWAKVAQATQYQAPGQTVQGYPHRRAVSIPITYSEYSLSGAASSMHNLLVTSGDAVCTANGITDKTINFVVAHSQGGIVSRATDKMYDDLGMQADRRFGGLVTFGSPHGGAMILNNKDEFEPFSTEACKALLAGPAEEKIQDMKILDFFISDETFQSIKDNLCNILGEQLAPIAFKDQFKDITEDYKVGAAPLAEINGYNSTIPGVALYGTETEPVFYRTVYNLKVKTPNQFPHFSADNDQELVDRFNNLLNKYKSNREINQAAIELLDSWGIPCTPAAWYCCSITCQIFGSQYDKAEKRKNAWQEGEYWLTHSNNKYKTIIGAYSHTWQPSYQCNCDNYSIWTPNPDCPQGCTLSPDGGYFVTVDKPSDGVVLAESAMAFPGAQAEEMPGSNHQQMRNDSNTKAKMLKLLGGGFGAYFTTAVR